MAVYFRARNKELTHELLRLWAPQASTAQPFLVFVLLNRVPDR